MIIVLSYLLLRQYMLTQFNNKRNVDKKILSEGLYLADFGKIIGLCRIS
jgi:hypothetical protein